MVLSTEKKITSSKLLKIKKLEDFNNHWNNYSLKVCSSYSFLEDREIFLIKKELSNFNVKYLVYKNSTFKKFLENNFPDYNANSSFFPEISGESAFLFSNNFDFLKIYQNYKKNNEKFIGFK
jgi:ribosomal protein L10